VVLDDAFHIAEKMSRYDIVSIRIIK